MVSSGQLANGKDAAQRHLDAQHSTLNDLDELGEIMTQMLQRQQSVEVPRRITSTVSAPLTIDAYRLSVQSI
jgi:hypothetical protein